MLVEAEYIVSPARTRNSPQAALVGSLPDGRQPEARRRTVNLDPGLMGKTKFEEQSHLKRFWNDSQQFLEFWIPNLQLLTYVNSEE